MAKNDKSRVNQASIAERNQSNQEYGNFLNTVNTNAATQTALNNEQARSATSGYQDIYNRGGLDPTVAANLRALNRTNSYAFGASPSGESGSSGGGSGGSSGGGVVAAPKDAFATSRGAFSNFINSGGVDIGAMKEALSGYRGLADTGGFSEADRASIRDASNRSTEIGKTGGFDPTQLAIIRGDLQNIRNIGQTGGIDPWQLEMLRGDVGKLREFGATGGLTPEDIARFSDPGYEEFARTGGWSPQDIGTFQTRALAPVQALGKGQQEQLENARRIGGGSNFAAAMAKAARGNAQELGEQAIAGQAEIADRINAGRQFGIAGRAANQARLGELLGTNRINALTSASAAGRGLESDLANRRLSALGSAAQGTGDLENALVANKLAGTAQGANLLSGLNKDISANQLAALGGITNTQQGAEEIAQRGKIAGAQGMFGVEQADLQAQLAREAQAAAAAAASGYNDAISRAAMAEDEQFWAKFNAGNEQYIGDAGLSGQLSALGGLTGLYGTAPGAQGLNYDAALGAMGGRSGAAQNALGLQLQSSGPSGWDRFMQIAGMAAPIAGAFTGGGAPVSRAYGPSTPNVGTQPIQSRYIPGWNAR